MTRSDLITSLADSGVTTNERGTAKSTYLLSNKKRISPSKALIRKSLPLQQDKLQHSQKKKAKPKRLHTRVCEGHLPGHFGYEGLATSERASASFKRVKLPRPGSHIYPDLKESTRREFSLLSVTFRTPTQLHSALCGKFLSSSFLLWRKYLPMKIVRW